MSKYLELAELLRSRDDQIVIDSLHDRLSYTRALEERVNNLAATVLILLEELDTAGAK